MSTPRSNLRVLILKPPNQLAPGDRAFTNGNLGAAYIVAALRHAGVETDYLDATVGFPGTNLQESFYRRTEMEIRGKTDSSNPRRLLGDWMARDPLTGAGLTEKPRKSLPSP